MCANAHIYSKRTYSFEAQAPKETFFPQEKCETRSDRLEFKIHGYSSSVIHSAQGQLIS